MIAFSGYALVSLFLNRPLTNTATEQLAMVSLFLWLLVCIYLTPLPTGLFLGCGKSLAVAGPGGSVLCYVLMGTVISSVISCLCEMTALMPVNAPVMEFPRRFLDRGVGFAVGWIYWYTNET
jgi:amino acid transporter